MLLGDIFCGPTILGSVLLTLLLAIDDAAATTGLGVADSAQRRTEEEVPGVLHKFVSAHTRISLKI